MNVVYLNRRFRLFFPGVMAMVMLVLCSGFTSGEINEKKIELAMRTIGHEVLLTLGDSTSRVMPIEKLDGHYKIPFEAALAFDPGIIIDIVDSVRVRTGFAGECLVEIEQCETKEIVHIFALGLDVNPREGACRGRDLPKACYSLLVTMMDTTGLANQAPGLAQNPLSDNAGSDSSTGIAKSAYFVLPIVLLLGLAVYMNRRKKPSEEDSDLVTIGSFQYDERNMALLINDETIDLSSKEAALLGLLRESANQPVKREEILQKVWGDEGDYVGRTLDVFHFQAPQEACC